MVCATINPIPTVSGVTFTSGERIALRNGRGAEPTAGWSSRPWQTTPRVSAWHSAMIGSRYRRFVAPGPTFSVQAAGFVVLTFLAILSGCRAPEPPPPLLRVGHAPHDHHAPLFVAATFPGRVRTASGVHLVEREFAKRYDLVEGSRTWARLSIDASTGGAGLIRRLAEDQLDVSFGGVPAILVQIDQGAPIRMLSPLMRDGAGLVIAKALPVRTWAGFLDYARQPRSEPLRIGYKADLSVQNLVFEQRLADAGIRYAKSSDATDVQIRLLNLSGARNLVPALRHGLLDGFVTMQPYLALAEADGSGRLVALLSGMTGSASDFGYPCCAIAARTAALEAHGEAISRFVDLMRVATDLIYAQPELCASAVSAWLGTTAAIERQSLPTTRFSMERDAAWDRGVLQWCERLRPPGPLTGALSTGVPRASLLERIYAVPEPAAQRGSGQ